MNGWSYTHNNDLLNALLKGIKFYQYNYTHCIFIYLNFFIHLTYIQLFINSMFAFLLQELDLLEYTYIYMYKL